MKAAIYVRVSTQDQEREGTSLDSQLEACLKFAKELGYEVSEKHIIREVWSGLTLDRPYLEQLRDWVRNGEVEAIIIYSTDRLSRDPLHLLLLVEEFEKRGAKLDLVTEPIDNSLEGQLLTYVRGWSSKVEALRIKDRTTRGAKRRVLRGQLPNGRGGRLYGYLYIKGKGEGRGIRIPDEDAAEVVRDIFRWLVEEGLSVYAITKRLRLSPHPPPESADTWSKSSIYGILTNHAYYGKTYVFKETRVKVETDSRPRGRRPKTRHQQRPREEWVEIPDATPAIISEEMFQAAQERLQRNRELSTRNTKREYLLRGFVKCRACGRSYIGVTSSNKRKYHVSELSYYRCGGRSSLSPVRCANQSLRAEHLDRVVWEQIEALLAKPELVLAETQRKQESADDTGVLERNLERVNAQLTNREKQRARVWKAFELTGDEETFKQSVARLQVDVDALQREKTRLEREIQTNQQFRPDLQDIKKACELVRQNLRNLSPDDKRQAMEALQVKVLIDGNTVEIEGAIPVEPMSIASGSLT